MTGRMRAGYAAPAFALALFGVPVFVHLPKFYADVLGAPLGALGLAILLTRAGDALLDPLVGTWSDRTHTRWGRRRPFLVAGAVPLGLLVMALFAPPVTGTSSVWWFGVTMATAFVAWTAVQIPHSALGAELVTGHHARTSLFALRDGVWMLGTLAAAAAPALVRAFRAYLQWPADERAVFEALGVAYGALLIVLPCVCALVVREPPHTRQAAAPVSRQVGDAWANRPYRLLLVSYAIAALGGALPGTLLFFFVDHVLEATTWRDGLLAIYFLSGFACLPIWARLAARLGKRRAFVAAAALSVITFAGALSLGPGDAGWFALIVVASGAGFGATLSLPSSMLADTLDYEELRTGDRREGLFTGLWGVTMKASAAVGAGLALPLLGRAGYLAGAEVQPPSALLAIRLLYCAVPCVCYATALAVIWRYPIDEKMFIAISRAVDARRRGEEPADPLTAGKI